MVLNEKFCNICKTTKSISEFGLKSSSKSGYSSGCKECCKERSKRYRESFPEKAREAVRKCHLEKGDIYKASRKYTEEMAKKALERALQWKKDNPDRVKRLRAEWKKKNKGKVNYYTAKRRASKINATPSWLSEKDLEWIAFMYTVCRDVSEERGEQYHVDHIIPLNSKLACGLHVPSNLQIITAKENIKKHNSFDSDLGVNNENNTFTTSI